MLKLIVGSELLGLLIALVGASITSILLIGIGMAMVVISFTIDIRYHARRLPRLLQQDRAA